MGGRRDALDGFRAWLIDKLSVSAVTARVLEEQQLVVLAQRLGVAPDALRDAFELRKRRAQEAGLQPVLGDKKAGSKHPQVEIRFPRVIFDEWKAYAMHRGVDGSVLLRSIVHLYLMGTWEPRHMTEGWVYRGREYSAIDPGVHRVDGTTKYPYVERALVTAGAYRALRRRAQALNIAVTGILRGLVVETMEQKFAKSGSMKLIAAREMWDDETRYYLGRMAPKS